MAASEGSKWLIGLTIYWFVYFLLIYSYVNTRVLISYPDSNIPTTPNAPYINNNIQRPEETQLMSVGGLKGYVGTMMTTLAFAFGFDTGYTVIGTMSWVFAFIFSYIPAALLIMAVFMELEMIIGIIAAVAGFIGSIGAALLAFLGL